MATATRSLDRPSGFWTTCVDELVSVDGARDDYGVVVENGRVDGQATQTLRTALRAQRGDELPVFDFGPERMAFERRWTPELQDAILAATISYQTTMRDFLRQRLFARLEQRFDAGQEVRPDEVGAIIESIRDQELTVRV